MTKKIVVVFILSFTSCFLNGQVAGCTDVLAKNYNPLATLNDGSCRYKHKAIKPNFSLILDNSLHETSGLTFWNGLLWTHNDDTDVNLYALDTLSGAVVKKIQLSHVANRDWEEIAQDSSYLYIGDFGNNYRGNRKDLHVLRIEKASLLLNKQEIDTISLRYSDQFDFELKKSNRTNFDCESMIATRDSLYLFTKQWKSNKTSIYSLPKIPGNYVAQYKTSYPIKGLITGSAYVEEKKIVALCGYNKKLKPFIYLLYDYKNNDFFSGNKRKIKLKLPFHQIEGITTSDGLHYYLTNENFINKPIVSNPQKLHWFDLTAFLEQYLEGLILK
ncbi:T9SS C-terminal target domain-containing protein [Flavobacterium luteum]|uniref:T9SS C-terminal target domain-containing protein n=1 Tax=Flavobacterium luteum TaxID=2026654 RepID=A0A7J5ADP7_9FLAO|nr:T9SS C-terminal target domain-containing protein [Flavobacterium luteum]KAB1155694.1 T9SS C-terminal target domain-containing protein [Flavobacterium luteum]